MLVICFKCELLHVLWGLLTATFVHSELVEICSFKFFLLDVWVKWSWDVAGTCLIRTTRQSTLINSCLEQCKIFSSVLTDWTSCVQRQFPNHQNMICLLQSTADQFTGSALQAWGWCARHPLWQSQYAPDVWLWHVYSPVGPANVPFKMVSFSSVVRISPFCFFMWFYFTSTSVCVKCVILRGAAAVASSAVTALSCVTDTVYLLNFDEVTEIVT